MKISRLEYAALLICAICVAFGAGWFARGGAEARPVRVETTRTLTEEQAVLALPAPTPTPNPLAAGEKININTAGAEELILLPGIGEKRAEDIVAYREANGPFRIPEDLTQVKGIGEGTLANLIDYITVE